MNPDSFIGFCMGVLATVLVAISLISAAGPTKVEGWYVLNAFMVCQQEANVDYMEMDAKGWKVRCNSGQVENLKE